MSSMDAASGASPALAACVPASGAIFSSSDSSSSPLHPSTLQHQAPLFGQVLIGLSRRWQRVLEARLAGLGLTDATWRPLFQLHAAGGGISLKALAQRMRLDSSTLVRVVDLLEARGLVVRETDASDRRSKLLQLTPAGVAAVAQVRAKLQQVEAQLLQGLAPDVALQLRQGMAALAERLEAMEVTEGADALEGQDGELVAEAAAALASAQSAAPLSRGTQPSQGGAA